MKEDIAIKVTGLSKRYEIGKSKDSSLRGTLSGVFKSAKSTKDEFWALKDVNFEIKKGDVVGIIGKNGAGKSTLLKVLSQITKPTEGRIEINGRVASLLEVGTGFHPELTGRENIYLNGTILGMSRKEVSQKFDEIVEFSGVQKFIDTPVKHYSSGMQVRLAFAIAAHLEPEILIIDEVLAVGDAEFQKKCLGKMKDVAGQGRTVLFVSHDLSAVSKLCKTGILLSKGCVSFQGNARDTLKAYLNKKDSMEYTSTQSQLDGNTDNFISWIKIVGSDVIAEDQKFKLKLAIKKEENLKGVKLIIRILNEMKNVVTIGETDIEATKEILFELHENQLFKGTYSLDAMLYYPKVCAYDYCESAITFDVLQNPKKFDHIQNFSIGSTLLKSSWN